MSHGLGDRECYREAAAFVDKIFEGAKYGGLPVNQPIKWD